MKNALLSLSVCAVLVGAGCFVAAPASAATSSPNGGTWNYGCNTACQSGYSNYYHRYFSHGSSTCTYLTTGQTCKRSATVGAQNWDDSSIGSVGGANNLQYYWR